MDEGGNDQQRGRKGRRKSGDLITFVRERLARMHASMSDLTGKVDDMGQRIDERESKGEDEKLGGVMLGA